MNEYNKIVGVYVPLLEEGTPTIRLTDAIYLGDGLYKILPTPNYDPEDEIWEFLPGSIVRVEKRRDEKEDYLVAIIKVG